MFFSVNDKQHIAVFRFLYDIFHIRYLILILILAKADRITVVKAFQKVVFLPFPHRVGKYHFAPHVQTKEGSGKDVTFHLGVCTNLVTGAERLVEHVLHEILSLFRCLVIILSEDHLVAFQRPEVFVQLLFLGFIQCQLHLL